jgi:hypothetical protein
MAEGFLNMRRIHKTGASTFSGGEYPYPQPHHEVLESSHRFVDRDMIMRYNWGLAVGHTYARQHAQLSKRSMNSRSPDASLQHQSSSELASDAEYEVETLIASRLERGKLQYLIHWKGYSHDEDSWEPEEHLVNSAELVHKFHKDNPLSPHRGSIFHSTGPEEIEQVLSESEDGRAQSSNSSDELSNAELEHHDDSSSSSIGALD